MGSLSSWQLDELAGMHICSAKKAVNCIGNRKEALVVQRIKVTIPNLQQSTRFRQHLTTLSIDDLVGDCLIPECLIVKMSNPRMSNPKMSNPRMSNAKMSKRC